MTFTAYAVNTVTGQNLGPIDCAIQSWTRVLNSSETASIQLNAGEGSGLNTRTRDWYRQITTPALMSIVIDWNGIALWAGPVWNRARDSSSVTISAAGLSTVFTRRKLVDPATLPYAGQSFAYTGISLGTIASRLAQFSLGRAGGHLPLVLPADVADTDTSHARTFYGYDVGTIGSLMSDLTAAVNGPDIDFRPQWTDATRAYLQWTMLVGTPTAPQLTSSNQVAFDFAAPQRGVQDIQVTEDASNLVTDEWAKGTGSGTSTLISHASRTDYTSQGWPLLEGENDYSDLTVQSALDGSSAGDLATYGMPLTQWGLTVDATSDPQLGSYQLGDLPTVNVRNDFWIPDGVYGMRIVSISGDGTNTVTLAVQNATSRGLDIPGSPEDSLSARVAQLERQQRSS